MDAVNVLGWIFLFISSLLSLTNLGLLLLIYKSLKSKLIEKNLEMNIQEINLMQRRHIFLQTQVDLDSKRIESIEKVLSAIIISNGQQGPDGMLH
jgi:hypothetical protein